MAQKSYMGSTRTFTWCGNKSNILDSACSDIGLLWSDGESVYLSSTASNAEGYSTALETAKTLGKFSDVVACVWSPCEGSTSKCRYLAVQQVTSTLIWEVTPKGGDVTDLKFRQMDVIHHSATQRGCVWHPKELVLVCFSRQEAICYSVLGEETFARHGGTNITAVTWTPNGRLFHLADGNSLTILEMEASGSSRRKFHQVGVQSFQSPICSMTPILDDVIAIATELPLQKIVTELSADLFAPESASWNTPVEQAGLKDAQTGRSETRAGRRCAESSVERSVSDRSARGRTDSDKVGVTNGSEGSQTSDKLLLGDGMGVDEERGPNENNGRGNSGKPLNRNGDDLSDVRVGSTVDPTLRTDFSVGGGKVSSRVVVVEEALKQKRGPIDVMELLGKVSQRKGCDPGEPAPDSHAGRHRHRDEGRSSLETCRSKHQGHEAGDDTSGNTIRQSMDKRRLICTTGNPPKQEASRTHMSSAISPCVTSLLDTSATLASSATPSASGWSAEPTAVGASRSSAPQEQEADKEKTFVDLTFLKPSSASCGHHFKRTKQPGADTSAKLMLLDARCQTLLSSLPLPGIITPSLLHHHKDSGVIIVGSHSRGTLSFYGVKNSTLEKLPHEIELEEKERPVGFCSLPAPKHSLLLASTKPLSETGFYQTIGPSTSKMKKALFLKEVHMTCVMEGSASGPEGADQAGSIESGAASEGAMAGDGSLATLLLPGGVAVQPAMGEGRLGEGKVGIQLLIDGGTQGKQGHQSTGEVKGRFTPDVRRQPETDKSKQYPSPECAETVELRHGGHVKSFLLQNGLLYLQTIQDAFNLSLVEMNVGKKWIFLTSDAEGHVMLSFTGGSGYCIREAICAKPR